MQVWCKNKLVSYNTEIKYSLLYIICMYININLLLKLYFELIS